MTFLGLFLLALGACFGALALYFLFRGGAQRSPLAALTGLVSLGAGWWALPLAERQSHFPWLAGAPAPTPHEKSQLYRMESGAELQVRLAALRKREADLLERKSELEPNDHAGAESLAKEIAKYNEDLKPVLQQLKERPELAQ